MRQNKRINVQKPDTGIARFDIGRIIIICCLALCIVLSVMHHGYEY